METEKKRTTKLKQRREGNEVLASNPELPILERVSCLKTSREGKWGDTNESTARMGR